MPDPIRFDVSNPQTPDAGPIIYISDDGDKWGRLTITLTNRSGDNSDLKLDPAGVLQIYFEMLTPDDVANIKVPGDSAWAGGPDKSGKHLELHPKDTIDIPSQGSIVIELHNVLGKVPRQGKFRFYDESLKIKNAVVQGFVQRPPEDAAKQWELACILDPREEYQNQGSTVYVTVHDRPEIANYLLVHLYRTAGGTLPSAGTPQLSFSFLTGDDDLALCSDERLKSVSATIQDQRPESRWKAPSKDGQGEDWVWTVDPANGGGDLFPEKSFLTLRFDGIVTDMPPGNSMLFIHYTGLTAYDDGYIQVPVIKSNPVPYLRSFAASSGGNPVANGGTVNYGTLELSWDVFAADAVVLRDEAAGPSSDQSLDPKDGTPVQATVAKLSYLLTPRVGTVDQPGHAGHLDLFVAGPTATVTVSPDAVPTGGGDVTVSWNCTQGGHCRLLQDGAQIADNLNLIDSRNLHLPAPARLTIECHGTTIASQDAIVKLMPQPEIQADVYVSMSDWPPPGRHPPPIQQYKWTLTLTWSVRYGTTCNITHSEYGPISQQLSGSWSKSKGPTPNGPTGTFRIDAVGPMGTTSVTK